MEIAQRYRDNIRRSGTNGPFMIGGYNTSISPIQQIPRSVYMGLRGAAGTRG